ncbi:CPBP family intramembrane metalloprotease [Candidatus Saccharibacteria bacterium]|nr:CPBP family intramembrane metalloprotease [Candidatus Saccharibacteria bacterium]
MATVALPLWVFLGFMLAQALLFVAIFLLAQFGLSFEGINNSFLSSSLGAIIYTLSVILVIGVPWLVKKRKTTREELGLQRLPDGLDLLWAPAGYVTYVILSIIVVALAMWLLPFVDFQQAQDTGFSNMVFRYEYFLAFISLVIVAPVAEEILFRGYLLGKLRKRAPLWLAILLTSLLFAVVHFAWNVGIDVFVLSIVLCVLRVVTGSLWAPIVLHMIKNGIAFYFLFINPFALSTLGG